MSRGRMSHHLKWCHIGTKTEQLSDGNNNRIRLHVLHFFALKTYYIMKTKNKMEVFNMKTLYAQVLDEISENIEASVRGNKMLAGMYKYIHIWLFIYF